MNDLTPTEVAALQIRFHAAIRAIVRRRAGHRCECYGMEFMRGTDMARSARQWGGCPIMGMVFYVDGDKRNWRWGNLMYVCQICAYQLRYMSWVA